MEEDLLPSYTNAFKAIRDKNWASAIDTLEELSKNEEQAGTNYLNARRYLGILYLETEEPEKAISQLCKLVKTKEKKFRDLSGLDFTFDKEKYTPGETEEYDKFLKRHLAWAYHDLGMAFLALENYELAELYLKEALNYNKDSMILNDLGWVYYKWDKPKQAISYYNKVKENRDHTGHVHFYLGLALIKNRDLSEAEQELIDANCHFDKDIQEAERIKQNAENRKTIAENDKKKAEKVEDATKKLAEATEDVGNANSKIIFLELMKASALNNLGRIEMEWDHYQSAKNKFREGLDICDRQECKTYIDTCSPREKRKQNKTIAALHNNIGLVYFNQGFPDEAKKEYMAAIKLEELPETYNNLAALYNKEGDKEKSQKILKNALRLNPNLKAAKVNLRQLAEIGTTNWWDWWFKVGSLFRFIVGLALVGTLLAMVGNMVCTSFGGFGMPYFNGTEITGVEENVITSINNSTLLTTITNSTTTTTTGKKPDMINKILVTVLIFFLLVHPQVKVFSVGDAKFEMETTSVSGSPSFHCEGAVSN